MTIEELINSAMRLNGELDHGQTASQSELNAGLEAINQILDDWSVRREAVFVIDNKQYPLTSGKQAYTMGPGGELDTERPVKIQRAGVTYYQSIDGHSQGIRKHLDIVSSPEWSAIAEKGMTAKEPLKLYNDNQYPLITLQLWPIPIC